MARAVVLLAALLWLCPAGAADLRLITLAPGHFHAALFYRERVPGVSERVQVYAPLGPDLLAHLNRLSQFNARPANPTHWQLEVHAGQDYFERLLAEQPGDVVVLSGNNRGKLERIQAIVELGLHALADKPWVLEPEELTRLEATLDAAARKGVVAYDAMTQRFELTCQLARELVGERDVFGTCLTGQPGQPAVVMESVHYLLKEVAGAPSLRPPWFFDIHQQGEGLTDVGTHLVDLVQWTLFPTQAIDYRRDLEVTRGSHWPTLLTRAQFERVTGEKDFPDYLRPWLREGALEYFANNSVSYSLRGVQVRLEVRWEFTAPPGGGDAEVAVFRGSRARVEVRQGQEEAFRPEVYVAANTAADQPAIAAALRRTVAALQERYPGLAVRPLADRLRLVIPDSLRASHEAHFALLTRQFLDYVRKPALLPAWEKPNMLAKYYVTTRGVALARQDAARRGSTAP